MALVPVLITAGALMGAASATADTSLALSSDPASRDWPGLVAYLTTADGTFTVQRNFQNGVSVRFQGPEAQDFWWLDFAAPGRVVLTPGLYGGAGHFPVQAAGRPGLNVSGQGLGCNAYGSFEILDAAYGSGGAVVAFHARFEQRCERSEGALVGDVRYEAGGTVSSIGLLAPVAERTRPLSFETRAFSRDLETIELTAPVLPDGAAFADATGGRGVFSWTPGFDVSGTHLAQFEARAASGEVEALTTRIEVVGVSSLWYESEPSDPLAYGRRLFGTTATGVFTTVDTPGAVRLVYQEEATGVALSFAAPGGVPLAPGVYDGAMLYPYQDPGRPGLSVNPGGYCAGIDGRFEVKEIRRGAFGEVLSFWATFEQTCVGAAGGLSGEIRYRADVPVLVRAPERLVRPAREPMTFDVQGFAHAGQSVVLAAGDLPRGARFEDLGDGTGRLAWTPSAIDAGRYAPRFGVVDEEGRADSAWTDLEIRLANDDFDGAYVIPALPFHDQATTLTATRVADDPLCDTYDATVWYAFTPPADLILVGSTVGSDYRTTLSAYVGTHPFPDPLLCAYGDLILEAHAGVTYYLMVNGREGGGRLEFSLAGYPPLEVGVAIDPGARLDPRTGDVTVGGTVTCTRPAPVALKIALAQSTGGSADRRRSAVVQVACTGRTAWSASLSSALLPGDGRRLRPRAASLAVEASAHDDLVDRTVGASVEGQIAIGVSAPGR